MPCYRVPEKITDIVIPKRDADLPERMKLLFQNVYPNVADDPEVLVIIQIFYLYDRVG